MTNDEIESYIDHESRIKLLEALQTRIEHKLEALEDKIDAQFQWIIGLIFVAIIIPVILHCLRLT